MAEADAPGPLRHCTAHPGGFFHRERGCPFCAALDDLVVLKRQLSEARARVQQLERQLALTQATEEKK